MSNVATTVLRGRITEKRLSEMTYQDLAKAAKLQFGIEFIGKKKAQLVKLILKKKASKKK